jgi:hypothetical protein
LIPAPIVLPPGSTGGGGVPEYEVE